MYWFSNAEKTNVTCDDTCVTVLVLIRLNTAMSMRKIVDEVFRTLTELHWIQPLLVSDDWTFPPLVRVLCDDLVSVKWFSNVGLAIYAEARYPRR
jgi:hypothetical protein